MTDQAAARIVLSGFPDYLAWRVCAALLRDQSDLLIEVLVAPADAGVAARAARELPGAGARLRLQRCVCSGPSVGLPVEVEALADEVGVIIHLAGVGSPCGAVAGVGTATLLDYAARCPHLRSFLYLSTAFVSGTRSGPFAEGDFDLGQGFKNAWEARAFASERAVRAMGTAVPITIARPPFVVGDARTGEIDRFDGPYAVLRLIDRLDAARIPPPMIGAGTALAQVVPVDFVAAALVALVANPAAVGRTVHLTDPDAPTTWAAYRQCAALLTGREPVWRVAPRLAARVLRAGPLRRFAVPPTIVPYLTQQVSYGTANANALLAAAGIVPPSFATYVRAVVDFYGDHCDDPYFAAALA